MKNRKNMNKKRKQLETSQTKHETSQRLFAKKIAASMKNRKKTQETSQRN